MPTALSPQNPRLSRVRELLDARGRRDQGCFLIEGPPLLGEARAGGLRLEAIYATDAANARYAAELAAYEAEGTPAFTLPEKALARLSDLETPPGILAVLPLAEEPCADLLDGPPALLLAGIADPGNAGTLLRSAEIFGVTRAIFTTDGVEPHNPKVVRATMGALFRMRVATATGPAVAAAAGVAGYTVVAAAREGVPLPEFRFPARTVLAIGNERHGVAAALESWDQAVAIPQPGGGESLNAAVAGGIILYAFSQQISR